MQDATLRTKHSRSHTRDVCKIVAT